MRAIDIKFAELGTVTSRVDGAIRFSVITPELSLEHRATILGLHGKNVRVMMEPIDVPVEGLDEVGSEAEPKSKCQRLRAVLYIWWQQTKPKQGKPPLESSVEMPFQQWYDMKMERFIEGVKDKLQ